MLIGYMRVSKADGSQATDLQRVALQIGSLGAVRLRYPHVAYQHVVPVTYTFDYVTV